MAWTLKLIYSGFAVVAAFLLAAIWGAGNSTMPLAAGPAHGSAIQESMIKVVAYSSAPTGIVSFAVMLWGFACRVLGHRRNHNPAVTALRGRLISSVFAHDYSIFQG